MVCHCGENKDNYNRYERGEYLHIRDYQAAIAIVEKLYPEYSTAIKTFNDASDGYYTNMFVMRKDIVDYSEWLFPFWIISKMPSDEQL